MPSRIGNVIVLELLPPENPLSCYKVHVFRGDSERWLKDTTVSQFWLYNHAGEDMARHLEATWCKTSEEVATALMMCFEACLHGKIRGISMGWSSPPLQQVAFKALQVGACSVGSTVAKDQANPRSSYSQDGLTKLLKEMEETHRAGHGGSLSSPSSLSADFVPVAPLNTDMEEEATLDHLVPDDPMGLGLASAEGSASAEAIGSTGLKPDEGLARAEGPEGPEIKPDESQQPLIRDENAIVAKKAKKVKKMKKEPGLKELKPSFDPISPASSTTVKKELMSPSKCVRAKAEKIW